MNLLNLFDIVDAVAAQKKEETPAGIPPAVQVSQSDGQPATIVVPVATSDEVEVLEDEHEDSLDLGDEVIITGNVQFQGKTGRIVDFGVNKHFVVVDLYNFGKHSFHSSNVEHNDYADSEEEDADWRERDYGLFGDDEREEVAETTGVTDYNPKSQGGTRKELLAKYRKTKDPKDAEAARKAGATQKELQGVAEAVMRGGDEDYPGDPDYEDRDNEDEGFFVAIGNEEDGMFLGMVTRDGGRWHEVAISGNPPYNWGGANYMSYLTPQDVQQWINKDYGRYNQVEFFGSEEEARDYVSMMSEGVEEGPEEGAPLDKYRERIGTQGNLQRQNQRHQDWLDAHSDVSLNRMRNQQRWDDATTQHHIDTLAQRQRHRDDDHDDWMQTFAMMRDRINRYRWAHQTPDKEEVNENTDRKVDAKGRTQQQWLQAVNAKFPNMIERVIQAKMIDGPLSVVLSDGRRLNWKPVQQGVAEGFLGDREYNRVMPFVKRIASEVSNYDRDEFGEELWSLLDQKYGPKFAQSVLSDIDFYWDTYTELTDQQGVAEGSETAADIDKMIKFHKQGQAAAQYKGSMNKMHAAKIRELEAKKQALKQGVAEGLPGSLSKSDYMPGAVRHDLSNIKPKNQEPQRDRPTADIDPDWENWKKEQTAKRKKQGVAEGGEWDEYTGGNPFPDSDELDTYSGEHDLDESSGIEYRGFDIRTSRDYITGEVVYWIYYRGRCTEHGNLTLDGAKKDIDYMIAAGFFNDPDEAARKKQQGLAEGSEPQVGDSVIITGGAYAGIPGRVIGFKEGKIVVDMLEQGKVRFAPERVKLYPLDKQGVAEGEYDDPRWDQPEPDMSRKVDWDIEAQRNAPEEPGVAMTVTVRDAQGNVVLQFPSTGEYYGDLKYAAKKGFDIEGDDYDVKWKRDTNEGNNWLDTPVSEEFNRIKKLAGLK